MKILSLTVGFLLFSTVAFTQKSPSIKSGQWIGNLQLNEQIALPFSLEFKKNQTYYQGTLMNGDEVIDLGKISPINDTFHIPFPIFNTELIFTVKDKKTILGSWYNYNKTNYSIPFVANYSKNNRFPKEKSNLKNNYSGKWETVFSKDGKDAYPALGLFNQVGDNLSGTFLTETGDYRYLDGNVYGNKLYLSCFDGSHAFLFTAIENENGELNGKFYSGKHWNSEWTAKHNEFYSLPHPDSITFVKESAYNLTFEVKDLKGKPYIYPNNTLNNKVVIIQLMGTWCPNCKDETEYFKQLFNQYHAQGLEILSVGYEYGEDFNKYVDRISTFKQKLDVDFTFLVGGSANKGIASKQFSFLNEIISFPTAIFIGRDGKIKRIHTGFNGPGTGEYYKEYVEKTDELIKSLISE